MCACACAGVCACMGVYVCEDGRKGEEGDLENVGKEFFEVVESTWLKVTGNHEGHRCLGRQQPHLCVVLLLW